ncbi:MAG: Holliday junction resolvase RuvX [Desulfobacterota bacterium]|nr:Holliday junction resolvase RuvX [Thermodesulfobacteriota bacterium]
MRIMALDIGQKRIGVAISDELRITAQGVKTIRRDSKEDEFDQLLALISQYGVKEIVVGLPVRMDGSLGKQAEFVLSWIEELKRRVGLPVITWDERLSTLEADRTLLEADLSRSKRRAVVDKLAAVLILQGYLQQLRGRGDETPLSS